MTNSILVTPATPLSAFISSEEAAPRRSGRLACHHAAVGQHHGAGGRTGGLGLQQSRRTRGREVRVHAHLVHQQLQVLDVLVVKPRAALVHGGLEVAAHDLHLRRLAARLVVDDGHARHVHAHVGGRLVGARAQDALHHGLQHGEDLNVAVVVDGGLAVGLQVERVDGVRVVQVHGGRLVRHVHRVLQRQVPNGERLVLRVAGLDAALVLVVQLRQARGHLARAGAGGRYHHQRVRGFHELVFAVAFRRHDARRVVRVAGDGVVQVAFHAQAFQAMAERLRGGLVLVARDHHAGRGKAHGAEDVQQAQHVLVVGDAQVSAHLVLLDVVGVDGDDDLNVGGHLLQHADLAVGLETRKHARGVVVVEQLSAEFQVQLAAELADSLANMLGLQCQVLVVIETDAHGRNPFP